MLARECGTIKLDLPVALYTYNAFDLVVCIREHAYGLYVLTPYLHLS